ncbi:MAG: proteinputative collagen-binding proteinCalx-beta [Planctomycetota bacterium]|nr:proteinputative collagen-binding proteinCalx-beta [Planctomycetota bacterium]
MTPFDIRATTGDVLLTGITPDRGSNLPQTNPSAPIQTIVTLDGAGFDSSTLVEFVDADGTVFTPSQIRVISPTRLIANLELTGWGLGLYDVRVTKGSASATLENAFRVATGQARLETNLVIPSALGFNIPIRQTIWIEYRNTGDAPIPAPLLYMNGDYEVRITTDASLAIPYRGFAGAPSGVTDSVHVLGKGFGATPWILQPGDSGRIPVYYIGLGAPASYPRITFTLSTITSDDARPIDWSSIEPQIRIAGLDDQDRQHVFALLQLQMGDT